MKGRNVPGKHVQKYGIDQDTSVWAEKRLTETGQWVVDIHGQGKIITLPARSVIDLAHKLSKLALDHIADLMLLFMKEKPDDPIT